MKIRTLLILLFLTPNLSFAFEIFDLFGAKSGHTIKASMSNYSSQLELDSSDYSFNFDYILFPMNNPDKINIHDFLQGQHEIVLNFKKTISAREINKYLADNGLKVIHKTQKEKVFNIAYNAGITLALFIDFMIKERICTENVNNYTLSCNAGKTNLSTGYRTFTNQFFTSAPEIFEATINRSLTD